MKNVKLYFSALLLLLVFGACTDDDALEFLVPESSEEVSFTSVFSSEYLLSTETANNTAERFVWSSVDFGVPTAVQYELQAATAADFSNMEVIGTTSSNNLEVKVRKLLEFAETLGLDNDPSTDDGSGNPNNQGVVYFRVRAFLGNGQGTSEERFSPTQPLNITVVEQTSEGMDGFEPVSWGIVGSAYNNWGDAAYSPDATFYSTATPDVFVTYVTLKDGEMKFRENNDWGSNLGDTGADGTLDDGGDNIAVSAGTYKITLDIGAGTYTIEPFSWGVVGSAWNDWGGAGPDAMTFYDYTTDSFKVGVKLMDGEMKFRLNNDWGNNLGDTGADGMLDDGGDNIAVTAGFYAITLDLVNNMYSLEPASLWGIVGSAYNDWGGAGPDFTFTQVNEGVWLAQNVTLLDGEMKFRANEDWGVNLGDTGADGILDDGGDNIAVTAGTYDIILDFTDPAAPTYSLYLK